MVIGFDAYMAGVADSDGSFSFMKRKRQSTINGYHYVMVFQLTWKKSDLSIKVMNEIVRRYGGCCCKWIRNGNNFPTKSAECLKYSVGGPGLDKLTEAILPYLLLKKKQAELIKEARLLRKGWKRGRLGKPINVWKKEDELYLEFNKLNGKNKKIW